MVKESLLKIKFALLVSLIFVQGCTLLGAAIDDKVKPKYEDDDRETLADAGFQADVEIFKHLVLGKPLPSSNKNKASGCSGLKGSKKTDCYKVSTQLSKSLQKHEKQ